MEKIICLKNRHTHKIEEHTITHFWQSFDENSIVLKFRDEPMIAYPLNEWEVIRLACNG